MANRQTPNRSILKEGLENRKYKEKGVGEGRQDRDGKKIPGRERLQKAIWY